jgi:hypothetical protein
VAFAAVADRCPALAAQAIFGDNAGGDVATQLYFRPSLITRALQQALLVALVLAGSAGTTGVGIEIALIRGGARIEEGPIAAFVAELETCSVATMSFRNAGSALSSARVTMRCGGTGIRYLPTVLIVGAAI